MTNKIQYPNHNPLPALIWNCLSNSHRFFLKILMAFLSFTHRSVCVCYLHFPFSNVSTPCAVLLPNLLQLFPPIFPSSFSLENIYLLIWILNSEKIKQWKKFVQVYNSPWIQSVWIQSSQLWSCSQKLYSEGPVPPRQPVYLSWWMHLRPCFPAILPPFQQSSLLTGLRGPYIAV